MQGLDSEPVLTGTFELVVDDDGTDVVELVRTDTLELDAGLVEVDEIELVELLVELLDELLDDVVELLDDVLELLDDVLELLDDVVELLDDVVDDEAELEVDVVFKYTVTMEVVVPIGGLVDDESELEVVFTYTVATEVVVPTGILLDDEAELEVVFMYTVATGVEVCDEEILPEAVLEAIVEAVSEVELAGTGDTVVCTVGEDVLVALPEATTAVASLMYLVTLPLDVALPLDMTLTFEVTLPLDVREDDARAMLSSGKS